MSKSGKKKKSPKRVLALPDLEQAKSAVLNIFKASGQSYLATGASQKGVVV